MKRESKNQRLMRLMPLLMVVMLLIIAGCSSNDSATSYTNELRGAVVDPPRELEDFSLPSTKEGGFTLSEHQGEVILIYFGYRSCPDFCPTTFSELRRVYAALDEPTDKLKIVFATIDPERDTLEYLKLYTESFHDDFIALRTEGAELQELQDQFGVVAEKRVVGDSAMSYLMDHTATVFLIGPTGKLEAQYLYGTDYRDIVHDLELILDAI